jgi:prepilin-type processing-associated H-X9-DG protein
MSCQNNLKQIGLAAMDYESANRQLPPGYLGPIPNYHYTGASADTNAILNAQNVGCLVFLLPYMEMDNIRNQMQLDMALQDYNPPGVTPAPFPNAVPWWSRNPEWTIAHYQIKTFQCPSDNYSPGTTVASGGGALLHSYSPTGVNLGPVAYGAVLFYFGGVSDLGKTNYMAVAGACWKDAITSSPSDGPGANLSIYEGIFTNRSKTRITDITDGTSNTLFFGEGLGGVKNNRDLYWSWMGCGSLGTKFGMNSNGGVNNGSNLTPGGWNFFCSAHSGGITQFCYADGSVHGLTPGSTVSRNPTTAGSDWFKYQVMSGKGDGQTLDVSSIAP